MTNIIVTAFCACHLCCGPNAAGITASGAKPVEGITVAASRSIPFGTIIHLTVPGAFTNRPFVIQDRLAKRFDGRVDLFIADHKRALKWGKREGTIQ